jgi:hypothetical protein
MNFQNQIKNFLDKGSKECWDEFITEINTDENKDYRRGFKAGLLCSHLYIKSKIGELNDMPLEHQTQKIK